MAGDDQTSSAPAPDCSYADAAVYVDAESSSRVIARLQDLMGVEGGEQQYLTVGPVRVYGARNGHATDRKAHPFDFLEWPTVLECEASAAPAADVVAAVATVLEALWRGGFKALAACDFEDELPCAGGLARYSMPPVSKRERAAMGTWWRSVLTFLKKES